MKLKHEERELGDWYEEDTGIMPYITVVLLIIGLVILIAEWTGLADRFINSFY